MLPAFRGLLPAPGSHLVAPTPPCTRVACSQPRRAPGRAFRCIIKLLPTVPWDPRAGPGPTGSLKLHETERGRPDTPASTLHHSSASGLHGLSRRPHPDARPGGHPGNTGSAREWACRSESRTGPGPAAAPSGVAPASPLTLPDAGSPAPEAAEKPSTMPGSRRARPPLVSRTPCSAASGFGDQPRAGGSSRIKGIKHH